MNALRRLIRREDGATSVEFAIIALVLFVVSIGTIEVGRALFFYNELAHAADRAVRLVLIDPNISDSELTTKIRDSRYLPGLVPGKIVVTRGTVVDTGITFRTVRLTYPFTPIVSGPTMKAVDMNTSRRVPTGT